MLNSFNTKIFYDKMIKKIMIKFDLLLSKVREELKKNNLTSAKTMVKW